MIDWLIFFAIPGIIFSFVVIGGGLFIAYLAIRGLLSFIEPSKSRLANYYFGYFWIASTLAIIGFLITEFGYQLDFWKAPGIWGAPGKESTLWGTLQIVFAISGFALGILLNAFLEHRMESKAKSIRIFINVLGSLLLIATIMLSAWHGMQTLG